MGYFVIRLSVRHPVLPHKTMLTRMGCPVQVPPGDEVSTAAACFNLGQIQSLPVTSSEVARATKRDPTLSKVLLYTQQGWPAQLPVEIQPFATRRNELTVEDNCLLWGLRVVILPKLQATVLRDLHSDPVGIVRMKSLAMSYFWWPGLDEDIQKLVKSCQSWQAVKSAPSRAPLRSACLSKWYPTMGPSLHRRNLQVFCVPTGLFTFVLHIITLPRTGSVTPSSKPSSRP